MMTTLEFRGFGGIRLEADLQGNDDDPAVLLLHGVGQTRAVWRGAADLLVKAGRRVISLDLRGHGASDWPTDGHYEFGAHVEDVRAVLGQLGTRPVVVAATLAGWIATAALASEAATLAAGLVLVDMPVRSDAEVARELGDTLRSRQTTHGSAWDPNVLGAFPRNDVPAQLRTIAPGLAIPILCLHGGLSRLGRADDAAEFAALLPNCETVVVEDADLLVIEDRTDAFVALLLDFLERKQPRAAAEFRAGFDARTLRDALGCFATGVTIVTTIAENGAPIGLTANSFTSVSLDPPLLLVCIANNAGSAEVLRTAEHFAINVLQIGQQPASNRFAGRGEDRFGNTPWQMGETGVPVLMGSLGSFECRRYAVHEGGDHFILVGEVVCARFEPRRDPLLYFRGKYRRLHFA